MINAPLAPPHPHPPAVTETEPCRRDRPIDGDDGLPAFMTLRPRLVGIARRMLGNAAAADDVVQDVWVRWQTADRTIVRNPAAFLVTATTRLAINVMQSARARRETCGETWLPLAADSSPGPQAAAQRFEGLEVAVKLLVERLSPRERAAYILREAFDYSYRDIARLLQLEAANARQVVTRARQRVLNERKRPTTDCGQPGLLEAVTAASLTGNLRTLEDVLVSDLALMIGHRETGKQQSSAGGSSRLMVAAQARAAGAAPHAAEHGMETSASCPGVAA